MVHSRVWCRGVQCLLVVISLLGTLLNALAEDEDGRDFKTLHQFNHPSFNQDFFNLAREALSRAANMATETKIDERAKREIRVNTITVLRSFQGLVCQELAAAVYQRISYELKFKRPDVPLLQKLLVTYISVAGAYNLEALRALANQLGASVDQQQRPLFSDQEIEKLQIEGRKTMEANAPVGAPAFVNQMIDLPKLYKEDPALTFYDIIDELRRLLLPIDEDGTYQSDILGEENDEYAFLESSPSPFNSLGEHLVADNLMAQDLGDFRYVKDIDDAPRSLPRPASGRRADTLLPYYSFVAKNRKKDLGDDDRIINDILTDAQARNTLADLLTEDSERIRMQQVATHERDESAVISDQSSAQTSEAAAGRPGKIKKVQDIYRREKITVAEWVQWENDLRDRITQELKGQDEVVEKFLAMEFRVVSAKDRSEKPEVVVLMGAPGTGKDTAVRSFVNALHASPNAWREHLYEIKPMLSKADIWTHLGSATGYTGSESLPPLINFLVNHSAGRYELEALPSTDKSGQKYKVVENPAWKKGGRNSDALPPASAIIYLNEFHEWSKEMKDYFLKMPLENGIFKIPDPKSGVEFIQVPVRFVIATNEGTELVAARESNGNRFGEPLSYEQQVAKWERWKGKPQALKGALAKTNNGASSSLRAEDQRGISEELLNRIPDENFILMRPLAPAALQGIAEQKLAAMRESFPQGKLVEFRKMHLTWTPAVVEFIQAYHYIAEENARPIEGRTRNLIEETLFTILKSGQLGVHEEDWELNLDVENLPDKTWDLVVRTRPWMAPGEVAAAGKFEQEIRALIRPTEVDKAKVPLSSERLAELFQIKQKLGAQVFGLDNVLERLQNAIVISEEGRARGLHEKLAQMPARSFLFLGLSSTGKTETAKALAEVVYEDRLNAVTMDFSQVQTVDDLKIKILGWHDGKNAVPSEFMKHYDRLDGKVLFIFDEIANAPRNVLKTLYDILREPVMTTFSDGQRRPMQNVVIIMTGNVGEEYFFRMPPELSLHMQRLAMDEIYHAIVSRPELLRHILLQHFSPAFLNRIGENNIFFFPPLSLQAQRELTLHKLTKALASLAPQEDMHGWQIRFANPDNFLALVDALEDVSLIPREQGASIDRFFRQDFSERLKTFLLQEAVPSGQGVTIYFDGVQRIEEDEADPAFYLQLRMQVKVDGRTTPLQFVLNGPRRPLQPKHRTNDLIITAIHEAGHQIVDQTFFQDVHLPKYVSIIPGVRANADDMIVYLGISSHHDIHYIPTTRGKVLRTLATFLGGTAAQELTSVQAGEDAGKSNDIQVASRIAYDAVLRWGLAPRWGNAAVREDVDMAAYIASLSEQKRRLLEEEVQALLTEGKELAIRALSANYTALLRLSTMLLASGKLNAAQLKDFYEREQLYTEDDFGRLKWDPAWWKVRSSLWLQKMWPSSVRDLQFKKGLFAQQPQIINLEELFNARKAAEVAKVKLPPGIVFAEAGEKQIDSAAGATAAAGSQAGAANCAHLLLSR